MIYTTLGLKQTKYNTTDTIPDFTHLLDVVVNPQEAFNLTPKQLQEYKQNNAIYALYGAVNGRQRRDDVLNRTVLFIDVDDESDYQTLSNRLANMLTALNINFVVYPTISNGVKGGARLRVGIELDRPVNVEEYQQISTVITNQLSIKGDLTAIKGAFKQLQGLYVKTSQNALNEPIIVNDGKGLPVNIFVHNYKASMDNDKNVSAYPIENTEHENSENGTPKYAIQAQQIIPCLTNPNKHYQDFGGWDNMLTAIGGWVYRQTYGNILITFETTAQVNELGNDPIPFKTLNRKMKSWVRGWQY